MAAEESPRDHGGARRSEGGVMGQGPANAVRRRARDHGSAPSAHDRLPAAAPNVAALPRPADPSVRPPCARPRLGRSRPPLVLWAVGRPRPANASAGRLPLCPWRQPGRQSPRAVAGKQGAAARGDGTRSARCHRRGAGPRNVRRCRNGRARSVHRGTWAKRRPRVVDLGEVAGYAAQVRAHHARPPEIETALVELTGLLAGLGA